MGPDRKSKNAMAEGTIDGVEVQVSYGAPQVRDRDIWGGLVPFADNQKTLQVEAATIRELLRKLQERYPGLEDPIRNEVAVAVDGVIYRDDWSQPLPEGAEVFLMRRLAGG